MAGNWDIRRIYLYLVSFATLMMMIIATVQFLQGIVNIAYPDPGYYSEVRMKYAGPEGKEPQISEADLKKEMEQERVRRRYYDMRSMINNLVMLGVALPVYMYHWRKIQRTET